MLIGLEVRLIEEAHLEDVFILGTTSSHGSAKNKIAYLCQQLNQNT